MPNTKRMIEQAKAEAHRLASEFESIAQRETATETDKTRAHVATLILKLAEKNASLLPSVEGEALQQDFDKWREEIERLAGHDNATDLIEQARQRALDALDVRLAVFTHWIETHSLEAWIEAGDNLISLKEDRFLMGGLSGKS